MANYVCSDLHGYLELYNKIKQFIKPEDTVFFLGDAGDRGPQPWETIKTIYKDSQFVYLKGNHEDLLVRAARDYLQYDYLDYSYYLHGQNGGFDTFDQWMMEEFKTEWINHLDNLPLRAEYVNKDGVNFIMTHAGFTPYKGKTPTPEDLLWDRQHFTDRWVDCPENTVIVHGHTSIPHVYDKLDFANKFKNKEAEDLPFDSDSSIYVYCGGHKICIDNKTYRTGKTVLFNLDTYEAITFKIGE